MRKVGLMLTAAALLASLCVAGPLGDGGSPLGNSGVPGMDLLRAAVNEGIGPDITVMGANVPDHLRLTVPLKYRCTGTETTGGDEIIIQAAIDAAEIAGCDVRLVGHFYLSDHITLKKNVSIIGGGGSLGMGARLQGIDYCEIVIRQISDTAESGSHILENIVIDNSLDQAGMLYDIDSVDAAAETITLDSSYGDLTSVIIVNDFVRIPASPTTGTARMAEARVSNVAFADGKTTVTVAATVNSGSLVDAGDEAFRLWHYKIPIVTADAAKNQITITGDFTGQLETGDVVRVLGSTGNDGWAYIIDAITFDDPVTTITLDDDITDDTDDGYLAVQSWCVWIDGKAGVSYDNQYRSLYTGNSVSGGFYSNNEWSAHYVECTFEHTWGSGFYATSLSASKFDACYFALNGLHGFHLSGAVRIAGNTFTDCGFRNNGECGQLGTLVGTGGAGCRIESAAAGYLVFNGCEFNKNSGDGLYIGSGGGFNVISDCVFFNNGFDGSGYTGTCPTDLSAGLELRSGNNKINGCMFAGQSVGNAGVAIFVASGNNNTITDCGFNGNSYDIYNYYLARNTIAKDNTTESAGVAHFYTCYHNSYPSQITDGQVVIYEVSDIADDSATHIMAETVVPTSDLGPGDFAANVDYPRCITVTDADGDASGTIFLYGILADGTKVDSLSNGRRESITIIPGGTATSKHAYASLSRVYFSAGGSGDVSIGVSSKIGVPIIPRDAAPFNFMTFGATTWEADSDPATNYPFETPNLIDLGALSGGESFKIMYKTF